MEQCPSGVGNDDDDDDESTRLSRLSVLTSSSSSFITTSSWLPLVVAATREVTRYGRMRMLRWERPLDAAREAAA
jgi:hypothetical protein